MPATHFVFLPSPCFPIFPRDTVFQARIAAAVCEIEAFREHINAMPSANTIALVGNSEDVQDCVIERKVRVLIVTGGRTISRELKKKTGENSDKGTRREGGGANPL